MQDRSPFRGDSDSGCFETVNPPNFKWEKFFVAFECEKVLILRACWLTSEFDSLDFETEIVSFFIFFH